MSSAYSLITARSFLRRNGIDPLPQLVLRHYDAAVQHQGQLVKTLTYRYTRSFSPPLNCFAPLTYHSYRPYRGSVHPHGRSIYVPWSEQAREKKEACETGKLPRVEFIEWLKEDEV